jgi:hypothetical protein
VDARKRRAPINLSGENRERLGGENDKWREETFVRGREKHCVSLSIVRGRIEPQRGPATGIPSGEAANGGGSAAKQKT